MRILILMSAILTMVSCGSSTNENPNQETNNVIIITNNDEDSVFDVSTIETVGELLDTLESITSDTITE